MYIYIYIYILYINFKAVITVLDAKMVLITHFFIKTFHLLNSSFVSLIRILQNIKQKLTQ